MKKKWIIILISAFAGIFALIYFVGVKNATKISFYNGEDTSSIAKKVKTTPDSDWILDPTIPSNYIPVPGETDIFMVLNEDGSVKEYRKRTPNDEGGWDWTTIENPTGKNIEKVKETPYGDVYRLSNDEFEEFKRFVIDENGGFAWVDTDENGLDTGLPTTSQLPDNYVPVLDNTYAVYNDNGVLQSFLKRTVDDAGNFQWALTARPEMIAYQSFDREDLSNVDFSQVLQNGTDYQFGEMSYGDEVWSPAGDVKTSTVSYPEQKEVDGYVIVYETVVTTKTDKDGNVLSTKKESFEKGRYPKMGDNTVTGTMAQTLAGEAQRLSSQVSFRDDISNQLLNMLNDERAKNGKQAVIMNSGELNQIAQIKAADMAITGVTTKNSATYGTAIDLANKYKVNISNIQEVVLETYPTDISNIHNKFMSDTGVKANRLSASGISIAVAEKNGKLYVYEIYALSTTP